VQGDLKPRIKIARKLRRDSTDSERRLWAILRADRLNGWKFRRQHPIGRYIADFACPSVKLIIELDGSQHIARAAQDVERTAELARLGWRVIRFWNGDVLGNRDGVAETILAALTER
jgi:very-short-patch-repair endonuclease